MTLFRTYIDTVFNGNRALAARTLGVSRSLISRIVRGERGVSPALAKIIEEESGGRFRKEQFIWVEAEASPVPKTKEIPDVPPLP